MTFKQIGGLAAVLAVFFVFGWLTGRHNGRNSVKATETRPIAGMVTAEEVAKGLSEIKPDTVFVPVPVPGPELIVYSTETSATIPKVVPIDSIVRGPERDAAIYAALIDWNTKRSYKGTLFDNKTVGALTYSLDVQFNRAGQIGYYFEPAPIPKARPRLRPTIGGEYYTNGQYAFGGGVQYGAFGMNVRALRLPKDSSGNGFAIGIGVQFIF